MPKFTKKPVTVEARQLTATNAGAIVQWITSNGHEAVMRGGPAGGSKGATVIIRTLEGNHLAEVGDFVIEGVQGEFYPCKPDIFALTYDEVTADPQPVDGPAVAIIVAIAVLLAVLAGLYVANVIRPAPAPTGDDTGAVAALNAPRQGDPLCRRFTRSHAGDTVPARRASVHCHATTTRRGIA